MCHTVRFQKKAGSLFDQILAKQGGSGGSYGTCGGRGACGKCRVRFRSDAPLPSFADRKFLTPKELREGYRLACTAKPSADCEVEVWFAQEQEAQIVTVSEVDVQPGRGAAESGAVRESAGMKEGVLTSTDVYDAPAGCFCAVDLGTTTVVMQLVSQRNGEILDTYAFQNPQRAYGTDVLSRITAAECGKAETLRQVLLTELENGLRKLETVGEAREIIISGNTTMGHLLLGYPVESLGKAPFTPYHIETSYFDLSGHPAVFLPGISAFVGADIVSGVYACGMAEREELSLFIDLGTNGEMAVGNRDGILCTATAAGSAFEGGVSAQVMGTDMTALAADMRRAGVMDETGLLAEPWFTEGYQRGAITIRQQDIRNLQMAKAAICAGASILLEKADAWKKVAHVYLAGGFGYYLDVEKAVSIGLIPRTLRGICTAVGNTSLAGAIRYGRSGSRDACGSHSLSQEREAALDRIVRISQSINLARQPEFETRYIETMAFTEIGDFEKE